MGNKKTFLSLGSNLGDRELHLRNAISCFNNLSAIKLNGVSSVYRSEPIDGAWGPDFYNMVVLCRYSGDPFDLLYVIESFEKMEGRKSKGIPSPRTLDIDILFYSREIINTERLTIPHPRLYHRKFVLLPLVEIEPNYRCPRTKKTVRELLVETDDISSVERLNSIII